MNDRVTIVGGGQAAISAAAKLRELNSDVSVTMICGEPVLPYQRPPLSKKYLSGEMPLDRLILRPQSWFDEQRVDVCCGAFVKTIDRQEQVVVCDDGSTHGYDKLLLATGSDARCLPTQAGGDFAGVHTLRSTFHADTMRPALESSRKLVVVGGGYIGLEVAAVARQAGLDVRVVEMADRILQRVAAPQTSDFYRDLHTKNGVEIIEGIGLSRLLERDGSVSGAELTDGRVLEADVVLTGIGIVPNCSLAENSGLAIENGISVDSQCATSDPNIFAAGDCASFDFKGGRIRLESVPNAIHQAEVAAENMLGGQTIYEATPWFWSDQYDVKLQIAGLNMGYDDTVYRQGKREGSQSIWYYRGEQLLAVDAMNDAPSFMMARRIIEAGKTVPKDVADDPGSNLKEWV